MLSKHRVTISVRQLDPPHNTLVSSRLIYTESMSNITNAVETVLDNFTATEADAQKMTKAAKK